MSLDVDGFTNDIEGGEVIIKISSDHRLLKLARLYFLGEPANAMRISCMVLIIAAIIGLKLSSH